VGIAEESAIVLHRGQVVKRLGDGVLATFLTAQRAVDAALDIQTAIDEIEVASFRPRLRAGVHWGSPRKLGGDHLGVDVTIAARVADAAKAGDVLVSDAVVERIDIGALRAGRPKRLRAGGAPRQMHVRRVSRPR